jgi:hypothetical protein
MIESVIRQDLPDRELLKTLVLEFYGRYKVYDGVPCSFFSVEGLNHLARTGCMADLPPQFVYPFTPDQRRLLLAQLKKDIVSDIYCARAINPDKFSISPFCSVQIYGTKMLLLITTNCEGASKCSCIEEMSILDSYIDFMSSLPDSPLLYSKAETLRIIDEAMGMVE